MRRFTVANHSCLMIKYARDDRYSDEGVATHDRQISSAVSTTTLKQIKKEARKHGVIGIDEGQFVSLIRHYVLCIVIVCFPQFPDIVEFCEEMANAGKTVIVAALDGTFQRKVSDLTALLSSMYI